MGEATRQSTSSNASSYPSSSPYASPNRRPISLVQPTLKRRHKAKVFRAFSSVFRSFPIITPGCKFPSISGGKLPGDGRIVSGRVYVTGTLFGYRKGRVSFSIQESSKTMPSLVIELAMQTSVLQKEMSLGMVRVSLECEKKHDSNNKIELLDEPLFTMFCNGKRSGYGVKRDATDEDLQIMEVLKGVSMGAGVLPGKSEAEGPDGEMAYMRAHFERVVGSRDSETFYMLSPEGNNGPELSIFFVRI
ncbi:hypothetical protein Leryth_002029 [Lithospermum erythrorhizon]|uniref:Protein MIZU-KUSSEI 1 n=1 Tax=Lithospermum erythrorhizon TaxID=34254 RepID=A0AAV3S294_LITER|nr:hypothetical protein Leryth_002029 [Lithospermum erythrorhizon]